MIAVNKNLANLNMYDITAFMFNDGKTLSSVLPKNTNTIRFSSAVYTMPSTPITFQCFGVISGTSYEIFNLSYVTYPYSDTYGHRATFYINGIVTGSLPGAYWGSSQNISILYKENKMYFSFGGGSYSLDISIDYDCVYFTQDLTSCTDLIIFDDQQNYFITNQDGLSLLKKINTEIYNGNTTLSAMFTSYSTFSTNLNSAKTYMQTNNKATIAETSATFYSVDRPAMKYKYDKTNRNVILYTKRPMTITPSITHNGTDTFYLVHIPKNLNSDSIFTSFLNSSTNLSVNQFLVASFKIGLPTDDTADIKIDYINRIDTIDELNIKLKLSNIIKQ